MSIQSRLLATYRDLLLAQAGDPEAWIQTPVGADLWIDGRKALRAASDGDLFARVAGAFLDFCGRAGMPIRSLEEEGLAALLARLDPFLEASAVHGRDSFWLGFALGLALLHSRGGPPNIETSGAATINDSLGLVLSPSYRAVRFAGYNAGIRSRCLEERRPQPFRPEYGHLLVMPPSLIQEGLPRVQYFGVSHDLLHIVLFGDAYLRAVGTRELTAALLLNAEETACTLDLVLVRDLARFGVALRALIELTGVEAGPREGRPSVTLRVACEGTGFTAYQAALKAAPQRLLEVPNAVSRKIADGVSIPADLDDWYNPRSHKTHAAWHEGLADRVWNPMFQRFISLLPPVEAHLENLHRFTDETWEPGEPILGEIPEPCPGARDTGVLLHRLRFLVIRAAEVAVELETLGSLAQALVEDLTGWALTVVEDIIRLRRSGISPAARERCEHFAGTARALLERHRISGYGDRFDDPMTVADPAAVRPYRSTR